MRRSARRRAAASASLFLPPGPAFAWGFAAHRLIMRARDRAAAAGTEAVLRTFADEIVVRVDRSGSCGATSAGTTTRITFSTSASPNTAAYPFDGAAARLRGRAGEVRRSDAEAQRAAAVARGRGIRQSAARLRGFTRKRAVRDDRMSCCSPPWRRTTSRMRTSRFTPPTTTTAS